jgi:hypothetical protein
MEQAEKDLDTFVGKEEPETARVTPIRSQNAGVDLKSATD